MDDIVKRIALFLLLVMVGHPAGAKRIPRWWMKVAQRQGPNACVVEEVPDSDLEFWTECRYWLPRKICGKSTRIRFECCEGYERISGEDGCTRVKPLMNVLETAEQLGATKWAQYIRESGLTGELEGPGAFTLFAPTNEAFDSLRLSLQNQLETYRGNPNNPILLYHLLTTKLTSDNFGANIMVETRHQGHSVRINRYSNGMTTINCALLIRKDQHATNGVVHVISSVLDPSIGILQNVADMVLNDGRFTVMGEILEKSGYINVLRTMQASITILAPSDEAFQKLPESRREKIINDREARLALLQNHIIPHVICESAVTGEHAVTSVGGDKLTFNCDVDGTYVDRTKLRGNFNLGKNGIIHMIDDVLLPDRAKNLIELAESRNLYTFVDLVRRAGLEETLSHTGDYTFFVPDEAAWYALDSDVLSAARRDLEKAGQLVRFHGAYGRHLTNAITDNQAIMSLNEEDPVRLQVWRGGLGVEDAKITEPDIQAQNGAIHIINKVIMPSNKSLADTLNSMPGRYSKFLELVGRVSGDAGSLLNLGPGDDIFYTFFVPSNDAFNSLDQATQRRLRTDGEYVEDVVKRHLAVNMYPPTAFKKGLIYTVNGMSDPFDIKMSRSNMLTVNGEEVTGSQLCANGVIHTTNKVFLPGESYTYTSSHSSSTYSYGGGSRTSSSSSSSRRNYKQSVTFAENYGGGTELPGSSPGTVGRDGVSATRRRTSTRLSKRKGKHSPSSSNSVSSPPPSGTDASSSSPSSTTHDDRGRGRGDEADSTTLEETQVHGSDFEAKEHESSDNSLGSAETHAEGSYIVREGSYSSSSYNPSSSSSSSSNSSSSSTTQKTNIEAVDQTPRRGDSSPSSPTRRPYDPDLDRYIPTEHYDYEHRIYTTSTTSRPYDPDLDRYSPPASSSSSSASSSAYDDLTTRTRLESASGTPRETGSSQRDRSDSINEQSDSSYRGPDSTYRGYESTHRESDSTYSGSDSTNRGSDSTRGGYDSTSRGSDSTDRGYDSTYRGSDSTNRRADSTNRESGSTYRGSDSTYRGSDSTNRRTDSTDRESGSTYRGYDATRGSDSTSRDSDSTSRGSDSTSRGSNSTSRGSDSTYRRYDSTSGGLDASRGFDSTYRGSESIYRGSDSTYRGSESVNRGYDTTYRGSESANRGYNTNSGGSDSTYGRSNSTYRYNYGGADTNADPNLGGSTGYRRSYNYSYNYSTGPGGLVSRGEDESSQHGGPSSQYYGHGASSNSSSSSSSSSLPPRRNTVGPVTPRGGRFSYVGHSYGQDVVGHTQDHATDTHDQATLSPLPLYLGEGPSAGVRSLGVREGEGRSSALGDERTGEEGNVGRRTYKYSQVTHTHKQIPTTSSMAIAGASVSTNSIVSRRRYHTKSSSYSTYSTQLPAFSEKNPSVFPASGLTGDEEMYADGAEFAETGYLAAQGNPEVAITREEAKALRKKWKKKRHQGRRRGGKRVGGGRRRRGRRGRRHRGHKAAVASPVEE